MFRLLLFSGFINSVDDDVVAILAVNILGNPAPLFGLTSLPRIGNFFWKIIASLGRNSGKQYEPRLVVLGYRLIASF